MFDPFVIVDLFLQGPRGWIVLAIGAAALAAFGWKGWRRFRMPRPGTQALLGGTGRFDAQNEREVHRLTRSFDPIYAELSAIHLDLEARRDPLPQIADRVLRATDALERECQRLDDLNIAFVRSGDHRQFLARIDIERGTARDLHRAAMAVKHNSASDRKVRSGFRINPMHKQKDRAASASSIKSPPL